jgi:acetolactate synthase regulatory subunit
MQNIVITPKSKQSVVFLKKLLSKLNDVKSVHLKNGTKGF